MCPEFPRNATKNVMSDYTLEPGGVPPGKFYREKPCDRCGEHLFRKNKHDCYWCREREFRPSWLFSIRLRERYLSGAPLTGEQKLTLGCTPAKFEEWICDECGRLNLCPFADRHKYSIYRIKKLREFSDLRKNSEFIEANCLNNLAIFFRHNTRGTRNS